MLSELSALLLDIRWLHAKPLAIGDPNALISDCNLLPADPNIIVLEQALRLSSHVVAADPKQLWSQLAGRIGIDGDLSYRDHPIWLLLPAMCSLIAPGEGLIRTIDNNNTAITAFVVLDDGKRILAAYSDLIVRLWNLETGKLIKEYAGAASEITAIVLVSELGCFAEGCTFGDLRLVNILSGDCILYIKAHLHRLAELSVLPRGQQLLSSFFSN